MSEDKEKARKLLIAYKPMIDAFKRLNTTVKAWHNSRDFPRTAETVNSIINRGATVDAVTLLYLAYHLGMNNKSIVTMLQDVAVIVPTKAAEVAMLSKLIVPVELNKAESKLVAQYRMLDLAKQKLVSDMVEKLK